MTIELEKVQPTDTGIQSGRTLSRRTLLGSAGSAAGLTIAFSSNGFAQDATPVVGSPIAEPEATPASTQERAAPARPTAPTAVDAYLRINEDGTATLLCGKVEYGQGIPTGFGLLVAEELSLPFESVDVVMGRTAESPIRHWYLRKPEYPADRAENPSGKRGDAPLAPRSGSRKPWSRG